MKKTIFFPVLLITAFLFFCSCTKNPFAKVEVSGRILDDSTHTGLPGNVILWGNDQAGTKEGVFLGEASTLGDGTFDLKVQAVFGNNYWFYFDSYSHKSGAELQIQLKNGHNTNLGNIIAK